MVCYLKTFLYICFFYLQVDLKKELKQLLNTDRPAVVNAISSAREHGDLKENAEYHAAKEQQGFIEGRIQDLNAKLAKANVIDIEKLSGDKVVFGATVTFEDIDTEEVSNYQIVGEDEADLAQVLDDAWVLDCRICVSLITVHVVVPVDIE